MGDYVHYDYVLVSMCQGCIHIIYVIIICLYPSVTLLGMRNKTQRTDDNPNATWQALGMQKKVTVLRCDWQAAIVYN